MELEVVSEKENPLLERKEIVLKMPVEKETPSRKELMPLLAKKYGNAEKLIFIEKIEHPYGTKHAKIYARLYSTEKAALREPEYLKKREEAKKKGEAPAAPAKKEKPAEAKAEAKAA